MTSTQVSPVSASAAAPPPPPASAGASSAGGSDLLDRALAAESAEFCHQHPNDARLAHKGHVKDVNIADVNMAVNGKELLCFARLTLIQGCRYGMVGRNGIGKTVLLRRIAQGRIGGFPAHLKCHLVEQEVVGTEKSALQTVMESDKERTRLLALEQQLLKESAAETAAAAAAPKSSAGTAAPAPAAAAAAGDSAEMRLADVYEQLAAIDADSAEARAAEILDELQFSKEMQAKPTSELSGGWRMRCALACALFNNPDILLLDEPTNHLDLHAVLWLTDYLQSLDITCVIVSHDARFLTDVTTHTIHFHQQTLHYYEGNFETFVQSRSENQRNIQRQQEALDAKRAHVQESIDRMRAAGAKKGHSEMKLGGVASRHKKLGRMGFEKTADGKKFNAQKHGRRMGCENNSGVTWNGTAGRRQALSLIEPPEPGFRFSFPEPNMDKITESAALLTLKNVSFGYDETAIDMDVLAFQAREHAASCERALLAGENAPQLDHASSPLLFANLDFTVRAGAKIGVVGNNGAGKSTLLQILCGNLQPSSGELILHEHAPRVAYFAQHLVEALDLRKTPVEHILALNPSMAAGANAEQSARQVLGRFGLAGALALNPIGTLSGGQKARCVFASITMLNPVLIVLDEPSNHLDLVTIQALVDAMDTFPGALLFVSHDQQLMQLATELWIVEARKNVKPTKINPNQLKAAAAKAAKEREAAAKRAKKGGAAAAAAASASSSASGMEKLSFPSRCTLRKLPCTFEEYRASVIEAL